MCWTQVVDHHNDSGASIGKLVAIRIGLSSQDPAGATSRSCSLSRTSTISVSKKSVREAESEERQVGRRDKQVLAYSRAVAGIRVEATSGGIRVAVGGPEGITSTIMSHRGFVYWPEARACLGSA